MNVRSIFLVILIIATIIVLINYFTSLSSKELLTTSPTSPFISSSESSQYTPLTPSIRPTSTHSSIGKKKQKKKVPSTKKTILPVNVLSNLDKRIEREQQAIDNLGNNDQKRTNMPQQSTTPITQTTIPSTTQKTSPSTASTTQSLHTTTSSQSTQLNTKKTKKSKNSKSSTGSLRLTSSNGYKLSPQEVSWYKDALKRQTIFESEEITKGEPLPSNVLKDNYGEPVDFLIAIKYVHCAVKLMVKNINEFIRPRYIWFISADKEHCKTLITFDKNIKCLWEDEVFPNFTSKIMSSVVTDKQMRSRLGWYYLQILNFGVARHVPQLSESYVVWDSDNVPMQEVKFFDERNKKTLYYTQRNHYHKGLAYGYHGAYVALTGLDMIHPDPRFTVKNPTPVSDWRSETWVAHFMVWYKPYVREILQHIEKHRKVKTGEWMFEVCKVVQSDEQKEYYDGFADYDTYGSFVKQFHPETMTVLMGSHTKSARPKTTPHYKKGTCCVPKVDYELWKREGWMNVVIEIHKGDEQSCKTDRINMTGLGPGEDVLN